MSSWAVLVECAYPELRRLARHLLYRERPNHTLQATALVNEALARVLGIEHIEVRDEHHFVRLAALKMRRLLVDHARARLREKRTGTGSVTVAEAHDPKLEEIVLAGQLLDRLAAIDERASQVMDLSYFGGLTDEEIAHLLDVSGATVLRDRAFARAWMRKQLRGRTQLATL